MTKASFLGELFL